MKYFDLEQWEFIPGFVDYFQASTHGRIKSVDRIIINSRGRKVRYKGKIRKPYMGNTGYYHVTLWIKGKPFGKSVHQWVAITFHKKIDPNFEVFHINNNKLDNHVSNLKWGSHQQNISDSIADGLKGRLPFGWERATGKYTKQEYIKVLSLYKRGEYSNFGIAKMLDMPTSTVYRMVRTYEKYTEIINELLVL